MFSFKYQLDDLNKYAAQLAAALGSPIKDDYLSYPEHVARGGSMFVAINDFITIQVANYVAVDSMQFHRMPSAGNNLTITFQDFTFAKCPVHGYTCNEIIANNNSIGSIQCKSTTADEIVLIDPDLQINVLLIHFKESWEHHIFKDEQAKNKLSTYIAHSNANIRKEFLSAEQNQLFKQILKGPGNNAVGTLFYQSKVFALLESFFLEILNNDEKDQSFYASSNDVAMIQHAEAYIISHLSEPFVGVDELARMSCMSRTKFINLFQKIYNISSYDYYQKKRLSKAYNLLVEGDKSLQEIANFIGYSGVQNFSTAFEKEFGMAPKLFLQQQKLN
jgi:AraC-like DNA-binding protein